MNTAVSVLSSIKRFIRIQRDSFEEYVMEAVELDDFVEYESETQSKQNIQNKRAFDTH